MLIEHDGKRPNIDPSARIAPNATICGDVTIGANTSVGFGTVVTAESGPVRVGQNCVIMDTAVLRGVRKSDLEIGDNVLVGPRCHLSGCRIDDEAFVATGATVLNGAHLGKGCEVRINGIVHISTCLPAHAVVPIGWVAVGCPAQLFPPDDHAAIWSVQEVLDFPRKVFGVPRPEAGETIMGFVMPRYARSLRAHVNDRPNPARLKRYAEPAEPRGNNDD